MKKISLSFLFVWFSLVSMAQTETYDLLTYTPPKGWKKETKENLVAYTTINNAKATWCQIVVYKSTTSKGSIEQDFLSEWSELVDKPYHLAKPSEVTAVTDADGWKLKGGTGIFKFNGADALVMLTTMSGSGRVVSITTQTNSDSYQAALESFMGSVKLQKMQNQAPATNTVASTATKNQPVKPQPAPVAVKSNYKFNTTNFDDGWVAVEQTDWVQVTKGNLKILIHYPIAEDKVYHSDIDKQTRLFWDLLVAPRYSNLQNFKVYYNSSYEPANVAHGNVTDKSGRQVYVVLFKKAKSLWMEFVMPDKNTFVQNFGIDLDKIDNFFSEWNTLLKMNGYNKFAVAASDLTGKWTTSFTGIQQYVNVYTGADAGMSSHSSAQTFVFTGNTYNWQINVASGFVGAMKFQNAKSRGQFKSVNNWQVFFSEMEGKPKTYNAYFSCVKGARILWLEDTGYAIGYTAYAKSE
jgi:hypothetical protein